MSLFEGSSNAAFAAHFRSHFPLPLNVELPTKPPTTKQALTYNVMYQVGVGAYGSVFKAKCQQTGDVVALKKIKLDASQNRHGFPIPAIREIKYLTQATHENSVKLHEIARGDESPDHIMTLVFEYVESDLTGYLKTITLTEMHRLCIMKQLLDGMFYAHLNKICHRDLKPSNILVSQRGSVKIADWGMCRQVLPNRTYSNEVVTLWYRAPELILGARKYGTEIDMWALGCVFAEMYLGQSPIRGHDEDHQMRQILQLKGKPSTWPEGWDKLARFGILTATTPSSSSDKTWDSVFSSVRSTVVDFFAKLLCYDPHTRLTAHEALDSDVFWGADELFPCAPNMLPTHRGDGVHEFQLREEEMKQAEMLAKKQRVIKS